MVLFITHLIDHPIMIELIAGVMVLLVVLGILYGVPRAVGSEASRSSGAGWPDILSGLEGYTLGWMERPRVLDIVLGIVTVVLLGAAVMVFQEPEIIGLDAYVEFVAFPLAILGFIGLFATTYLSVRRSGLHGAEATLLASTLVGTVLIILVTAMLLT